MPNSFLSSFKDLWFFSASPEEIREKYYPEVDPDIFYSIGKLDPQYGADPLTKWGPYAKWVMFLFQRNRISQDQFEEAEKILQEFHDHKPELSRRGMSVDLYDYMSLDALKEEMEEAGKDLDRPDFTKFKNGELDLLRTNYFFEIGAAKKLGEDATWLVVELLEFPAGQFYGIGSEWCTRFPSSFESYRSKGGLITIIKKPDLGGSDSRRRTLLSLPDLEFSDLVNSGIFKSYDYTTREELFQLILEEPYFEGALKVLGILPNGKTVGETKAHLKTLDDLMTNIYMFNEPFNWSRLGEYFEDFVVWTGKSWEHLWRDYFAPMLFPETPVNLSGIHFRALLAEHYKYELDPEEMAADIVDIVRNSIIRWPDTRAGGTEKDWIAVRKRLAFLTLKLVNLPEGPPFFEGWDQQVLEFLQRELTLLPSKAWEIFVYRELNDYMLLDRFTEILSDKNIPLNLRLPVVQDFVKNVVNPTRDTFRHYLEDVGESE